jgi:hypothetical protein
VLVFTSMSLTQGVGDRHPGQYLPFWQRACDAGSLRACTYRDYLTLLYCNNGSGWACNEWGIPQLEERLRAIACAQGWPEMCGEGGS